MTGPVLEVEDLWLGVSGPKGIEPILRGVSMEVAEGEACALVGESGAGKSMLAKAILHVTGPAVRILGGRLVFKGEDLLQMPPRARRALGGRMISLTPQDPMSSLNPSRRIGDQVMDVLRLRMGMRKRDARARAVSLLDEVRIHDPEITMVRYPHQLSGGMRQRVLIAIAFACNPALILADEATTALDVTVQKRILRILKEMQRAHGTSILFITHDMGVVAKFCDRIHVIHSGFILEQGSVREVFERPAHPFTQALIRAIPAHGGAGAGSLPRPVPESVLLALEEEARARDHLAPGA